MGAPTLPCAIACALLASCSGAPVGEMQLAVDGATNINRYEVRIFGAAMGCDQFVASPSQFRTFTVCTDSQRDTSTQCHIEMAIVTGGPVRMQPIPDGTRTVTILGFSAPDGGTTLSAIGCADNIQVKDGQTAQVSITMLSL